MNGLVFGALEKLEFGFIPGGINTLVRESEYGRVMVW
jgi:hypothetical protein